MKKALIVIDMQNDFIDGSLGTAEALSIVENVKDKIRSYPPECVFATMDTHGPDYLSTQEGRNLPVEHCIRGKEGWKIRPVIEELLKGARIFEKPTFGSERLAEELKKEVSVYPTFEEFSDNAKYVLLSAYRRSKKNENFSATLANSIMILSLIRNKPFVTTKELAEKLELSERTVQRYIETLRVAGEWIEYDVSRRGWMLSEGKSMLWGDI